MYIKEIELRNGLFFNAQKSLVWNGWQCQIDSKGNVACVCGRDYKDGKHTVTYTVYPDGYAELERITPKAREILKSGYVIGANETLDSGVIGLSGGNVDERFAYFRNASFRKFMGDFCLDHLKRKDPNMNYIIRNIADTGQRVTTEIVTDGKTEVVSVSSGMTETLQIMYPGAGCFEEYKEIKVADASYVIVKEVRNGKHKNTLYSMQEVRELRRILK